jgi:hypothetical protein
MRTRIERIVFAAIPSLGVALLGTPIVVLLGLLGIVTKDWWWITAVIFVSIWTLVCGSLLLLAILIKPSKAERMGEEIIFDTEDDEEPDGLTRERV